MAATPLAPGDPQQLGDYWLAGRLGAGGQGVVYEGYDPYGNRVAVKALHAELITDGYRDRFAKEVAALQRVSSFCTARVIDAQLDGTPPYVVSEYVPGPDLQQAVERGGAFAPDELHRLAIGVATALTAIHRAGVIHRDLKPANVLLGPDGPRVIDFGIARTEEMSRSATGQVKGTPRYMAPEVFRGLRAGPEVDVWAWGAVVMFAALGRPPFDGDSLPAVMNSVLNHQPRPDGLPEPLRSVVAAALAKDPAARPSAHQVLMGLVGGSNETGLLLAQGQQVAAAVRAPQLLDPTLAQVAEQVYDHLDPAAREAVPRVLLRMVTPGEGAEDTLRAAKPLEFADGQTDDRVLEQVIGGFMQAGLLTYEGDTVAISNAALLRAWPRLRDWVDTERDGLGVHQALTDAARLWYEHGRKSSDLYQGTPLERAMGWAATGRRNVTLNTIEREFLDAGAALTRRRGRQRTLLVGVLAVLLVISVASAGVAVTQTRTVSQKNQIVTHQRDEAVARRLASVAAGLRQSDPRTGRRIAIAAARLADVKEVREQLISQLNQLEEDLFTPPGVPTENTQRALSQDGRTFVTGTGGTVRMWDVESHRQVRTFNLPGTVIKDLALSGDNRTLAVTGADGRTRLWDAGTGRRRPGEFATGLGGLIGVLELSARGRWMISTGGGATQVWNTRSGRAILRWKGAPTSLELAPDERRFAMAGGKGYEVWDLTKRKRVPMPKMFGAVKKSLNGVAFSPDGRLFALQEQDTVHLFDLVGRRWTSDLRKGPGFGGSLTFSSDGRFLAANRTIWQTEGTAGEPLIRYAPRDVFCGPYAFGPQDKSFRCVDGHGAVASIDVSSLTKAPTLAKTGLFLPETTLSQDASVLAYRSGTQVQIWDARRRVPVGKPFNVAGQNPGTYVTHSLKLSRDGKLLAVLSDKGSIEVWDVPAQRRLGTGRLQLTGDTARDVEFSPDGAGLALVTTKDGVQESLQFWDARSVRLTRSIRGRPVNTKEDEPGVAFSSDGKVVASGGGIGVVEFPSGRPLAEPNPDLKLVRAISPDGATIAAGPLFGVQLWDAKTLQRKGGDLRGHTGFIRSAAFSPDGKLLATGDSDGSVRLWDVEGARPFGFALFGHTDDVRGLAFSPDGKTLYSAGEDETLRAHVIDSERAAATLCGKAGGGLSKEEWRKYISEVSYRPTC